MFYLYFQYWLPKLHKTSPYKSHFISNPIQYFSTILSKHLSNNFISGIKIRIRHRLHDQGILYVQLTCTYFTIPQVSNIKPTRIVLLTLDTRLLPTLLLLHPSVVQHGRGQTRSLGSRRIENAYQDGHHDYRSQSATDKSVRSVSTFRYIAAGCTSCSLSGKGRFSFCL